MNGIEALLSEKADFYNCPDFIDGDPISVPHAFSKNEDIEIAGLFAAIIAWGNRKSIIQSARKIMNIMDNAPHDFIINHQPDDLKRFNGFVHRTFQANDAATLVSMLQPLYRHHGGLKTAFSSVFGQKPEANAADAIVHFRKTLLSYPHERRFEKHLSNPEQGSAAKRLNMFLRWMVRRDRQGVDFGLWTEVFPMSSLLIPLDVHTARVARRLGILQRKQNDLKAVLELSSFCRSIDPVDPARFDFALFGIGLSEKSYL